MHICIHYLWMKYVLPASTNAWCAGSVCTVCLFWPVNSVPVLWCTDCIYLTDQAHPTMSCSPLVGSVLVSGSHLEVILSVSGWGGAIQTLCYVLVWWVTFLTPKLNTSSCPVQHWVDQLVSHFVHSSSTLSCFQAEVWVVKWPLQVICNLCLPWSCMPRVW